jgi:hypothetical protein
MGKEREGMHTSSLDTKKFRKLAALPITAGAASLQIGLDEGER